MMTRVTSSSVERLPPEEDGEQVRGSSQDRQVKLASLRRWKQPENIRPG